MITGLKNDIVDRKHAGVFPPLAAHIFLHVIPFLTEMLSPRTKPNARRLMRCYMLSVTRPPATRGFQPPLFLYIYIYMCVCVCVCVCVCMCGKSSKTHTTRMPLHRSICEYHRHYL
ncbi:hypothetical protein, unlikely [Trypanosoma brucei gambiense DAL972]|uniref:Uncharacterized protein n=1 Tax=Trypanosoma brucei gambiense (strain MHOM/CI/86/DAL972) TaxID=679716 RepID=D0A6Q1_TRYB9|nr:hypothetical protein, unlikely [Trypanosoma brucei gambiense DAL972]CBH17352.1 hypothetical protein, unlikely [Trypanosoma brucei gambiense DAL972]|eukprot:XP_011779616.1 hypothetical protein, unlikely [Trypanosoma brucei gambiense DAL972]